MRMNSERGAAVMFAIVGLVVASILIVAVVTSVSTQRDRSRDARDQNVANGPASEGIRAYAAALSSGRIGEHTGFQFTRAALVDFIRGEAPGAGMCASDTATLCLLSNASTPYGQVDAGLVPAAADRLTVRRRVDDGEYLYWQILAVSPPRYGLREASGALVSPGGGVVVFVRAWQGNAQMSDLRNRPVVHRATLRPPSFSDFQLAIDGQMYLGSGLTVNGRLHSNGYRQSLDDQFSTLPAVITLT